MLFNYSARSHPGTCPGPLGCIVDFDDGPLRHDEGVHQALDVKEGKEHLLGAASVHPCLNRAWFALFYPLLGLVLSLSSVIRHHRLIQCDDLVQHRHSGARRQRILCKSPLSFPSLFIAEKLLDLLQRADFFIRPNNERHSQIISII